MSRTWSHSVTTSAQPQWVWSRWTTPASWAEDDPATTGAEFPQPPKAGDVGSVSGSSGSRRFHFTEVVDHQRMTFEIRLPGARLVFPHTMEARTEGLRVTHAISVEGLLAPLYTRLIARRLAQDLPQVVGLVLDHALAEGGNP